MKTHLSLLVACALAAPVLAFESEGLLVACDAPGLHAVQVDHQVVAPLAKALEGTPGLARCIGVATTGAGRLVLLAADGADLTKLRTAVAERLAGVKIPDGSVLSLKHLLGALDRLYVLSLRDDGSRSAAELTRVFDEVVRPSIQVVPGVAEVQPWTGCLMELHVALDAERLAQHDVTACEVLSALRGAVKVASLDDVAGLVIAQRDGTPTRVRDVATVSARPVGSGRHLFWVDGSERAGAVIGLARELGDGEALKKAVEGLRADRLPEGVTLELFGPPDADLRLDTSVSTDPRDTLDGLRRAREACASLAGGEALSFCAIPGPGDGVFPEGDSHILVRCERSDTAMGRLGKAIQELRLYPDVVRGRERSEVTLQVFAPNHWNAEGFAEKASEAMRNVDGAQAVRGVGLWGINLNLPGVDKERISACGVKEEEVLASFEIAEDGVRLPLDSPVEGARTLRLLVDERPGPSIAVRGQDGRLVPLRSLVSAEFSHVPAWILTEGGEHFSGVRAWFTGDRAAVEEAAKQAIQSIELPGGARLVWGADLGGL